MMNGEDLPTCVMCGDPMYGGPSMGGDRICGWCDCGIDRDGRKWDMTKTKVMIGKGSVFGNTCTTVDGCDRVSGHPGFCFDKMGKVL